MNFLNSKKKRYLSHKKSHFKLFFCCYKKGIYIVFLEYIKITFVHLYKFKKKFFLIYLVSNDLKITMSEVENNNEFEDLIQLAARIYLNMYK